MVVGRTARGWVSALAATAALCIVVALAGCGPKPARLPTYQRSDCLYLQGQPFGRLYVEVDVIDGIDVPDRWLDELKAFLSAHCSKPDGIEIVRDKPIPVSHVSGLPIGLASVLCTDGPRSDGGSPSAYLHVFFYDTRLLALKRQRAHVDVFCPCTIFYDMQSFRWQQDWNDRIAEIALEHEAGHVIGLCPNPEHGNGLHCRNSGCLMCAEADLSPWPSPHEGVSLQSHLCGDCRQDLDSARSQDCSDALSFVGPFLIRQESDYSVASLPHGRVILLGSARKNFDWQESLQHLKGRIRSTFEQMGPEECKRVKNEPWHAWRVCYPPSPNGSGAPSPESLAIATGAANDPCPIVSSMVKRWLETNQGCLSMSAATGL